MSGHSYNLWIETASRLPITHSKRITKGYACTLTINYQGTRVPYNGSDIY